MRRFLVFMFFIQFGSALFGQQTDTIKDSGKDFRELYLQSELLRFTDSIKKAELVEQIQLLKETEQVKKSLIVLELQKIEDRDSIRKENLAKKIETLKLNAKGYPVTLFNDTIFLIYNRFGASMANERAANISKRIKRVYDAELFYPDSIFVLEGDHTYDVVYGETIVMTVSEADALWNDTSMKALATQYANLIKETVLAQKQEQSLFVLLKRIGLVLLVLTGIWSMIWVINYGHRFTVKRITLHKDKWLKNLSYKDYTFLSAEQELKVIMVLLIVVRWFFVLLLLYLLLPLVFSIFPFTRGWAGELIQWVWSPFKGIFVALWDYLPNLFSIIVIYLVMKYFIRFIKYLFTEIETERLKISGFHADWAMPTFSIVRFLLFAFMFVLIFPYLPGSDSEVFKGVSVFIGILFSLGSSTAIANMVAGLVITYMRPFKIGDRIKIGEMTGDVIEKTLLVTRLRTVKNEEITIPNSSVLSGNTVNYSALARTEGLIIHTTVTIGYDVPWRDMHLALIEAALRVDMIQKNPEPFVLQTALDDFYVSYQVNAYTREVSRQAIVYSELHKNIQDVCNERGIEILSPHYRAQRDGNATTIPSDYLNDNYKVPGFNVNINPEAKNRPV